MEKMDLSIGIEIMDRWTKPMRKAINIGATFQDLMAENQKTLRKIGQERSDIRKFEQLGQSFAGTTKRMSQAIERGRKAKAAINKTMREGGKVTKAMVREHENATKAVRRLRQQHNRQNSEMGALRSKLRGAGFDTRNLAREQERLGDKYAKVQKKMRAMAAETERTRQIQKKFDDTLQRGANISLVAGGMRDFGQSALGLLQKPKDSLRRVERSKGELRSLGVEDTQAVIDRGRELQRAWAYMDTSAFVSAAYDIKSGIAGLSDTGIADVTAEAAITAKATKAEVATMTSLFATGFNIFKGPQFGNQTNQEFAETFGASIAGAVEVFKTTGTDMEQAIKSMGAGLTISGVDMREQMAALGMLQGSMDAGAAGTTLAALERSSAQAQERFSAMGSSIEVLDANGNMRGLADLLQSMQDEFGREFTTETGFKIQEAFGSEESVKFFKQLWGQQDQLKRHTAALNEAGKAGGDFVRRMAGNIDNDNQDARLQVMDQRWELAQQKLGKALIPLLDVAVPVIETLAGWVEDVVDNGGPLPRLVLGTVGGLGMLAVGLAPVVSGLAGLTVTAAWLKKSMVQLGIANRQQALANSMGGGRGGGGFGGFMGRRGRGLGRLFQGFRRFGGKGGLAGAALGAFTIGSTLMDDTMTGTEKAKAVTKDAGGIAGGLGGAALGATIGTMILPGVGTAIGGLLGGWLGSEGGSKIGETIGSWFGDDDDETLTQKAAGKAKAAVASVGVATAVTAGATAQDTSPVMTPLTKGGPVITDQSTTSINLTMPAVPPGASAEEYGRIAADYVEKRLREIKQQEQIEKGAALYDTGE